MLVLLKENYMRYLQDKIHHAQISLLPILPYYLAIF